MSLYRNGGMCTPVAAQSLLQTQQSGFDKLSQTYRPEHTIYYPLLITMVSVFCVFLMLKRLGQSGDKAGHAKPRDASLDHLKWILSGLVTYSHLTMNSNQRCGGYIADSDKFWDHPAYSVYLLVHLFMMPSFCFLSGLFSQSYVKCQEEPGVIQVSVANTKLQGTMMNIFMMAQLMTVFVGALRVALHYDGASLTMGERVEAVFLDDRMELWYIVALLIWRLLLPFWTCLRWGFACSFLMAILPNLSGVLGVIGARTCGYFPFFIAGFMIDKGTFEAFRKDKRSQMAAIALFAVLTFLLNFRTSAQVLDDITDTTGQFNWRLLHFGLGSPAVYYSTTFACTAAALSLGTVVLDGSWGSVLDQMSTRSLYNYSGFMLGIILLEQFWDWSTYMNSLPDLGQMVFTMSLSLGFLMFNTCWPVWYVTSSLCEPNTKWLFKSSKPKV